MILGVGLDLVDVARLQKSLERFGDRLLQRIFHASEISYCGAKRSRAECLAATFAVKEAFLKALGTGLSKGIRWLDMEVVREQGSPPLLKLGGRALEILQELGGENPLVSISHEAGLAAAMVLIQKTPKGDSERWARARSGQKKEKRIKGS